MVRSRQLLHTGEGEFQFKTPTNTNPNPPSGPTEIDDSTGLLAGVFHSQTSFCVARHAPLAGGGCRACRATRSSLTRGFPGAVLACPFRPHPRPPRLRSPASNAAAEGPRKRVSQPHPGVSGRAPRSLGPCWAPARSRGRLSTARASGFGAEFESVWGTNARHKCMLPPSSPFDLGRGNGAGMQGGLCAT